jgi:multidrug resistance efflux pump
MGHSRTLRGHVDSIARAISVSNAQPNNQGVATVNPIFTWVRLAQRIPVRIHLEQVPSEIVLTAGMTATVEIEEPRRVAGNRGSSRSDQTMTEGVNVSGRLAQGFGHDGSWSNLE